MNWTPRLEAAFAPEAIDPDVLEELAQHAAAVYASARAEGCGADEAQRRVEAQIAAWAADPAVRRRRPRLARALEPPPGTAPLVASIAQDARYAWRLLRRQPAHTALVVATMALGIAAATVLGSITYGVLLKPLPWADAPRLVRLYETRQGSTKRFGPVFTNGTYRAWRDSARTLDAIGAWNSELVAPTDQPGAPRLAICRVTPSLFTMLQAAPALGRGFAPGEDDPGRPPIVVLSYGYWQQQFGGRADAIGSRIRFDTTAYTVVGVMPAWFAFPNRETRAWMPFYVEPPTAPGRQGMSVSMFQAIGRLKPGSTPAQAAAEGTSLGRAAVPATPIAKVVAMAVFGTDGQVDVTTVPMLQALTAEVRPAILILLAAVVLLLATATANVASLQLARATARRRELAVRAALGAGRGRLVRQTLVEHVLLGLLGGIAGLALAAVLHRALPSILPADFPRVHDIALGWRIQAFAVAISLLAGIGCGILPAWHVARTELVPSLAEDALAPAGGGLRTRTARARAIIMAAQIATACVLLVGALLLTRSFVGLMRASLGYDTSNVLTARLILTDGEFTPERRFEILEQLRQRLTAVPGVTHAAYANTLALTSGEALSSFPLVRRDGSTVQIQTGVQGVSPDYFASIGQRVVEGRGFAADDASGGQPVVIVNREFSRRYLDGAALGWTLPGATKPGAPPARRPIVGVVEDTVRRSVTDAPQPEIYGLYSRQQGRVADSDIYLVVRTAADPQALAPTLRDLARNLAPSAPLESLLTMRERVADSLANPRLYASLLAAFALFALLIAGVGLFGVLSYSVTLRAREIGVRTALGAQLRDIVVLVVRQSMAIAVTGLAVGIAVSYWVSRLLQTVLHGVSPHDAISYAAVAFVLLAVAALASVIPARRAAQVDPVRVLRS
jgi:predicted permease